MAVWLTGKETLGFGKTNWLREKRKALQLWKKKQTVKLLTKKKTKQFLMISSILKK